MLDLNILKKSGYFKELILEKGDILFNEGQNDDNIYIIRSGELSVEKYTTKQKNETKILAYLKDNDIFGEASLNTNKPKEVNIIASKKSIILSIDAKKGLSDFSIKYPNEALNILKYIIYLGNKRLSESNYLITASYKISKEIIELDEINNKHIFDLIDILKDSIGVDHIIYYEVNPVINTYITMKYDTRQKGKMLNKTIEIIDNKLNLLDNTVNNYNKYIQKLSIGTINLGYLMFLRENNKFSESDIKVITTTSTSIAGLIKEKQLLDEERDKEYMEE